MKFYVIGINDSAKPSFCAEIESLIKANTVFSGGNRHYTIVKELLPKNHKWINITPALAELFNEYKCYDEIVVFASGDPLFYGFAATIQRLAPDSEIICYPSFNSLQLLAHQLVLPYQDMVNVSLTGRPWDKFDEALIRGHALVGVLTDTKIHTPSAIAQRMLDYSYDNYEISVGELLGNVENQRLRTMSVEEVARTEFKAPNCMILRKVDLLSRSFGIEDSEFELLDGRKNMISKRFIRLASISELDLGNASVFWDIGFCTASVSIEAKSIYPYLKVISFEIREEGRALFDKNTKLMGVPGISCVIGDFLKQDLMLYPRPDAVFIGGHGGRLALMLEKLSNILNVGGRVVFNSVSEESLNSFDNAASEYGFEIVSQNQVTINNHNTITILKAVKL